MHHHHNDHGHALYCPTADGYDCLVPIIFKATDYDDFHFGPADHNHDHNHDHKTIDNIFGAWSIDADDLVDFTEHVHDWISDRYAAYHYDCVCGSRMFNKTLDSGST